MQRRLFYTTCAIAAIVAPISVQSADAATTNFNDITNYPEETQQEILNLVELGIIKGTSPTTFSPKESITRGQVVKMLGRFLVNSGISSIPTDWERKQYFTDLSVNSKDRELLQYAAVVKSSGVFIGKPDGSLASSEKITRENMALVLDRATEAMRGKSLVELANYEEGNIEDISRARTETRDAVNALNVLGISNVSNFNPKGNVLRVHFASFLTRAIPFMTEKTIESTLTLNAQDYGFLSFSEITNIDDTSLDVDFSPSQITISGEFTQNEVNTFIDWIDIKGTDLFGNERFVSFDFVLNEETQLELFNEKNSLTENILAQAFLMDSFINVMVTSANREPLSTNENSNVYAIKKDTENEIIELTFTGLRNNESVTETVQYYVDFAGNIVFNQKANNHSLNYNYYIANSGDVVFDGHPVEEQTFYYIPVSSNENWTYTAFQDATTIEEILAFFITDGTKAHFDFDQSEYALVIDGNKNVYGVLDLSKENGFFEKYTFELQSPANITIKEMYAFGNVILKQQPNGTILATATGEEVEGTIVLIIDGAGNEHYFEIAKTTNGFELMPYNVELFYK
ncbi:S-layer homology domain-containing protein [Lysinibacillus endophyticus]|uniref:S-layer homology domain-containing protein n=1 Tax=Ureibacillus endophyticus TaxID=1978490 RepID=A0A494YZ01_9BACL|nr:S-layer homology domain-containing protein [Lysinibacillus endophyticus]RKQ15473.1 S-layer homology domain-containing protein [Lysinibacillus endophyticus]